MTCNFADPEPFFEPTGETCGKIFLTPEFDYIVSFEVKFLP